MKSTLVKKRIRLIAILLIVAVGIVFAVSRLQVEPADYRVSLNKQITKAEKLIEKAEVGNGKGQYAPYTVKIFQAQIEAARQVAEDEESYYEIQKEAYNLLKECVGIFKDSKNSSVLQGKEVEKIQSAGQSEEYQINLSLYRTLKWTLAGNEISDVKEWNLYVREDGPYYNRMLAYMEEFQMQGATLAFYHEGDFPGKATVTASYYPKTDKAYVYEIDPETNMLSYVIDGTVANEQVTFSLEKGGSYVILAEKLENYADEEQLKIFAATVTESQQEYDILSAQNVKEVQDKIEYLTKHGDESSGEDVAVGENIGFVDVGTEDANSEQTENAGSNEGAGGNGQNTGSYEGSGGNTGGNEGSGGSGENTGSNEVSGGNTGGNEGNGGSGGSTGGNEGSGGSGGNTGSNEGSGGTGGNVGNTGGNNDNNGNDDEEEELITVYISIDCHTLTGDGLSNLVDENLAQYVPSNGVILGRTAYQCAPGTSVYEVLYNVCRNKGIHIEASYTPLYSGYYIEGINYLYEFHGGTYSGWLYRVNDVFPNYGCSQCFVEEGDEIIWSYTCQEGDVPGTWM